MKAIKLVAVAILGATTLGVVTPAFAGEVDGQSGETTTTVTIKDAGDQPGDVDLKLRKVPSEFNFTTALRSDGEYELTDGTSTGEFVVFNNKTTQTWSVKSTVVNKKLTSDKGDATVTGFKINDQELTGTALSGIVFKNAALDNTNTGDMKEEVTKLAINFNTTANLKKGDTLSGTISHQLYDTATAE